MKRKVILLAGKTSVISLPSSWINKWDIKKGDELELIEMGNMLNVKTTKQLDIEKETVLNTEELGVFDKRYVADLYKYGYDEIKVIYDNPEYLGGIKRIVDELIGYEIVNQGENFCVIKSVANENEMEFDNILRKVFFNILEMSSSCLNAVKNKDFEKLKEIRLMEKTNNKLTDFCLRVLNKYQYFDHTKTSFIYAIIRDLEKIGDNYKYLCDHLSKNKKCSSEHIKYFEKVNNYFKLFYEIFYKYDKEKAKKFYNERSELISLSKELHENSEDPYLTHLLSHIADYSYDVYGPHFIVKLVTQ